jgi:2-polyprenyl-3-methyl-5-hydroxy-6-metoxy-1,4-benzoquinol methylase
MEKEKTLSRDQQLWEAAAKDFIKFVQSSNGGGTRDFLRENIIFPTLLNKILPITNKVILDAGCGEGIFSRILSQNNPLSVTGVDSSPSMIEAAKNANQHPESNINYVLSSLENPNLFPKDTFDIIIVNMVFQEMGSVENVFRNLVSFLKKGGQIYFSVLHPAFDMNDSQRLALRNLDQNSTDHGKWEYELFSPYNETRRHERNYTFSRNPICYYYRPINYYVNLILRNHLVINAFEEPTLSLETLGSNRQVTHAYFLPRFLFLGGEKK